MSKIEEPLLSKDKEITPESGGLLKRLSRYDRSFLANLSLVYINNGLQVLVDVVLKEILREKYGLEGDEIQKYMMFIFLPWDFKILYGIICDTLVIPCFEKTPKRGYIILLSTIQL